MKNRYSEIKIYSKKILNKSYNTNQCLKTKSLIDNSYSPTISN